MDKQNPLFKQNLDMNSTILITQELLIDLVTSEGCQCESIFNSPEIPAISLQAYMKRIHKYTQYSPECLVIAIVYIDRYNMAQPQFSLNWFNVHRVLLTCIMLAAKFHNDVYYNNITFEKAGGVNASKLFQFEMEIFQKLDFSVFVSQQQYQTLLEKIYLVYTENEESEETQVE